MQATSFARGYLHASISVVHHMFPEVCVREFVDDLMVKVAGSARSVPELASSAVLELVDRLQSKKCIISPKSAVLASKDSVARDLAGRLRRAGLSVRVDRAGRDLGADTAFGQRRVTRVAAKRRGEGARAARALGPLLKVKKAARKLYQPGPRARAMWGHQVHGLPPTTARSLRALASKATGYWTSGICPVVNQALCFGLEKDPE
eukprot:980529-Alexandrium_andersonii.AAC.1